MPLALLLISTLVIGSTLPVATTLFTTSPRSTLASFVGSILVPPLRAAISPPAASKHTTTMIAIIQITLRRRFPFPFTTVASRAPATPPAALPAPGRCAQHHVRTPRLPSSAMDQYLRRSGDLFKPSFSGVARKGISWRATRLRAWFRDVLLRDFAVKISLVRSAGRSPLRWQSYSAGFRSSLGRIFLLAIRTTWYIY